MTSLMTVTVWVARETEMSKNSFYILTSLNLLKQIMGEAKAKCYWKAITLWENEGRLARQEIGRLLRFLFHSSSFSQSDKYSY